ncbi:MAG: ribosomal RNA small subunit methyltransferase E [Candidatus Scalindua rubra]|uniref:Ribosomal RNA small subunit methyltransferase E n=1 Tax=Candidatus Scalindua rubra TaxID=1872076 RepID=A0A1E3XCS2_9BACT|nr:MAG: ribosomal RNA small subunit methyltransferase E [Candidatus Scalindua rubra]
MNRFYVPFQAGLKNVWMDSSESHHMVHVKRLRIGDKIILFNGMGDECHAEIIEMKENKVKVKINQNKAIDKKNDNVKIDIAFAIPKGKRSHFLVQKCTELGVHKLIPIHFERSVVKLKTERSEKIEKWRRIAIETSKQCGRNIITEISNGTDFCNFIKNAKSYDLSLFACNQSVPNNLKNTLQEHLKVNNIISFIGPEGGFTSNEIEMAKEARCKFVSLGQQILRVETAAIAISAILSYHYS